MGQDDGSLAPEAVATIIEGIHSKTSKKRNTAIKLLPKIAHILGPDRTVHELIPYYIESTSLTEADIGYMLSQIAAIDFKNYSPENFQDLFSFIKELAEIDIDYIRKFFAKVIEAMEKNLCQDFFEVIFPHIAEMLTAEYPPTQMTALAIFAKIGPCLPIEAVQPIIDTVEQLEELPDMLKLCYMDFIESVWDKLDEDTQDSTFEKIVEYLENKNSRIMMRMPSFLAEIEYPCDLLKDIFLSLLEEPDYRIRIEAVTQMGLVEELPPEDALTLFKKVSEDKDSLVLAVLAKSLPNLAERELDPQVIRDFISNMLTFAESFVAIEALNSLPKLRKVLGDDYVKKTIEGAIKAPRFEVALGALNALNMSDFDQSTKRTMILSALATLDWRGRHAIASIKEYASDPAVFARLAGDDVFDVRRMAVKTLKAAFAADKDIPRAPFAAVVERLADHPDYQMRQTAVYAAAQFKLADVAQKVFIKALHDPISNVRLTLAEAVRGSRNEKIIEILRKDLDEDVRDILL